MENITEVKACFTYTGVASVVTSLWNVREKTNKEIIYEFYREVKNGKPKDDALRAAKIKHLSGVSLDNQINAHPYYWSPMVLIGDPSPIQSSIGWIQVLTATLLLLFMITLYQTFRKRSVE